jgi:hypothetical protein
MNSVFIGGSRRLGRMNAELARRLDNITQKELRVLIGDANGFDRAAQKYLADHGYRSVCVYCTNGQCRNNVGDWPKQAVEFSGGGRGFDFYTAKDDAMLRDADYGLFAWDGTSKGTLRNIRRMAEQGKPSAVYVSSIKKFVTVRNANDAIALSRDAEAIVIGSEDLFADAAAAPLIPTR